MAVSEAISSRDKVFGIPVGGLGLFSCVFMGIAIGVIVFFATCFLAILALLFYNRLGHHAVDLAIAYRDIALPAGIAGLIAGEAVMVGAWLRHRLARG